MIRIYQNFSSHQEEAKTGLKGPQTSLATSRSGAAAALGFSTRKKILETVKHSRLSEMLTPATRGVISSRTI